jgi:NAD(P)-dependent dehydrogenase (short-subunit alcohol dehydrogenase family)
MQKGEHIWIIGGSGGIGAALAELYARRGARLLISGRRREAVDRQLAKLGPGHAAVVADVADRLSLEAAAAAHEPFDRIISTAAIYDPGPVLKADPEKAKAIFEVNLLGSFNVAQVGAAHLKAGGQLVLFGSAAAIVGLPQGQVYSATKAGIVNLAHSLRTELWPAVDVRLVTPGFVRTDMTALNNFEMPFIMEPEDAAERIFAGLEGKSFQIAFPKRLIWPLRLLALLPDALKFRLTARLRQ